MSYLLLHRQGGHRLLANQVFHKQDTCTVFVTHAKEVTSTANQQPAGWREHPTYLQPKCFCIVINVIQITRKVNSSSRNCSGSFLEVMTLLEVPMRNRMGYTQQKVWACFLVSISRFLLLSSSVTWPWDPLAKMEIWSQRVTLESLCWCQPQLGSHRRSLHCSCCHPGCVRTDMPQGPPDVQPQGLACCWILGIIFLGDLPSLSHLFFWLIQEHLVECS